MTRLSPQAANSRRRTAGGAGDQDQGARAVSRTVNASTAAASTDAANITPAATATGRSAETVKASMLVFASICFV